MVQYVLEVQGQSRPLFFFPLSHFPTINFDAYFQLSQAAFWDLVSFTEPG